MASEIRANTIKNRVGLSTINITDTGIVVSGVSTFSGVSNFNSNVTVGNNLNVAQNIIHTDDADTKIEFLTNTICFDTAGDERLRITSDGRIGINDPTPNNYELDILKRSSVTDAQIRLYNNETTSSSDTIMRYQIGGTTASNYIYFGDSDDTNAGQIRYQHVNDSMQFNTAGDERLRITSTGSVGIGTNNPDVGNTAYPVVQVHSTSTNAYFKLTNTTTGVGSGDGVELSLSGSDAYLTNRESANIIFRTGGSNERVRITQDGLVGINTTNPTGPRLEVVDSNVKTWTPTSQTELLIERNGNCILSIVGKSDANSVINFGDNDDENAGHIDYDHASNSMAFRTNTTEKLRIASAGQIGLSGTNYGTAGQVLTSGGSSAAPSWSGGAQRVLEVVASPCDGSTIATSNGNVTFQNVTAQQNLSTTYADVNGSTITYQPPAGTTQVIYEFNMQVTNHDDAISIAHLRFYIDGTEVVYHRRNASGEDIDDFVNFKYIINIGGTADANTGRIASWSNAKEMKMTAREYHASNNAISLHTTDHWNGSGTNQFSQPILHITAIGI